MVSGVMDMLEQEFQVLTAIEQGKIIGGSGGTGSGGGGMGSGGPEDYVDSLLNGPNALFSTSGLTEMEMEKDILRDSLINIENANMGDILLHDLQSTMAQSSSGLISFSDVALSNGVSGQYQTGTHTIELGPALSDGFLADYNFVHELAHADLDGRLLPI